MECEGDEVILSLVLRLFKKSGKRVMVSHGVEVYRLRLELSGSPLYALTN